MADPVLRIPVDDEAFKRYLAAFQRYQTQLQEQPDMWEESNTAVRDGIVANLALADAIGASVSAAVRLGDVQARNSLQRKRDADREENEQQRSDSWRRKSLDHVQELSRTAAGIVRGFGNFASGSGGAGGLFGGISAIGKGLGGTAGGIINLIGHTLNAGYDISNAVSDKGLFARGIGATISQQEGFRNNLGRLVNSDQGIDAVMNARGDARQWSSFARLGIRDFQNPNRTNTDLLTEVYRRQAALAKRYTKGNVTNWNLVDALGGTEFGTTHEDLNRLMKDPNLAGKLAQANSFKSSLTDKETDSATKLAVAQDNLTTKITDAAQKGFVDAFNPSLDKATKGLMDLYNAAEKLVALFPSNWNLFSTHHETAAERKRAEADPHNPRGKGFWGGLKAMWDSPWFSIRHADTPDASGMPALPKTSSSFGSKITLRDLTKALISRGVKGSAAVGSAAGIMAEGGGLGMAKNGAFGIGQWRGPRYKALIKKYGPHPTLNQQLDFLVSELNGGDYGGKSVLAAPNADAALNAYAYKFMRPNNFAKDSHDYAADDVRRGRAAIKTGGTAVAVNITVSAPPGHQASISTNSAAKG